MVFASFFEDLRKVSEFLFNLGINFMQISRLRVLPQSVFWTAMFLYACLNVFCF
jgi:hypothetical protein